MTPEFFDLVMREWDYTKTTFQGTMEVTDDDE